MKSTLLVVGMATGLSVLSQPHNVYWGMIAIVLFGMCMEEFIELKIEESNDKNSLQ